MSRIPGKVLPVPKGCQKFGKLAEFPNIYHRSFSAHVLTALNS